MRGFTLTELAVVLVVLGLLLAGTAATLTAQVESRNRSDTQRRLEEAKELLLGFALVNGRLPCPGTASGDEAGGGAAACASSYAGFLPARTIGFQPTDAAGFGLDAWGHRMRYAVSATAWGAGPARYTRQHTTGTPWSITQTPADLVICSASPAVASATSCDAGTGVTNQNTLVAIVFSTGRNSATGGTGTNEARNLDGNALFVSRVPDPPAAAGGEFDDLLAWIPVGQLYGRMIAAGVLP
ncbi:MAG: prepilin-type N-terminal cleavage/methylation domain-containing protein [Burkholderiales bacterium]